MFSLVSLNDYATYIIVLTLVLLISTLWYFWFVYRPYAKFPSFRLEHRIPYWVLKRVPLNYAVIQNLIKQARRNESEGMMTVWLGAPVLLVYGEDIVKKIVNEPAAMDKPNCYRMLEFAAGKGILTSNGDLWKKQWKMAAPAFHIKALKSYTTIMNKNSEEMIQRLSELNCQPTEDIIHIVSLCAMGITLESNLGEEEFGEKSIEEYTLNIKILSKVTDFLIKRMWSPWLYFDFALGLFPLAREVRKLSAIQIKGSLKPRLEKIKETLLSRQVTPFAATSDLELNGRKTKSFGESFVEQHLQDPSITMDEVTSQLAFIVGAAFDTVVHAMKFALYLLGTHSDVQKKAFEEVMSETEGHVTYDELQRLTYLECVIKESLRMYPVPIFGRYLRKDLQCGKYEIPQNTTIFVFSYMLHRNPEIYPEPEKFKPERFMDENSKIRPWNFIPFAEGLRYCIGKNYAMNEMKIMLAHILRNFEVISLDKLDENELNWSIILECTKKLWMQFLPRKRRASLTKD